MYLLDNPIKDYPWGSRTDIAALMGRPVPAPGPEAEMWIGAHPAGPSRLETGGSLADAIAADPVGMLGASVVERFGARLPYLMKLIAVAQPLSLQVHPTAEQAAEGYRRGVYGDPWPKPELVCALTPFTALAGFRPAAEAAMLLDRLGVRELAKVVDLLARGLPVEALRVLLEIGRLPDKVIWAASAVHHPDYALAVRFARRYPGDPACLAPLLLRRWDLAPFETLSLGAGVLHCYVKGFGVEIMGSSDNVVRAGLTNKPVNIAELLSVTNPAAQPGEHSPEEFQLGFGNEIELDGECPRIVLCTAGHAQVAAERIGQGQALFVPASHGPIRMSANGNVFWARSGTIQ